MNELYFPSCNFTKSSPEAARRLRAYLKERMPVAGCCRTDALAYPPGSTALYFCQACRETLEARAPGALTPQNLFTYLIEDPAFPWPDYSGLTATIQDCWRDRHHPEIFDAVRIALQKMGVTIIEMEENREKSTFCGNLHFEPRTPRNIALLAPHQGTPLYELPEDIQSQLMAEQAAKLPCALAVTYCNRCTQGIRQGGGKAVHLMELAMGTYTPEK